jgi:polysaccharide export outer membrane protein
LVLLSVLVLSGCETVETTPPPPPSGLIPQGGKSAESSPDLIRSGNKVTITFSETATPPPPHEETVREDGKITPPLIGSVVAAGKLAGELQDELHKLYVPSFYKRLTVTVRTDNRFYSVDGEVRTPSLQPYVGEMTLLKGIASAGGFTDFAKKWKVHVIRPGRDKPIVVDCDRAQRDPKLDIPIFPQDRIWVPRRYL